MNTIALCVLAMSLASFAIVPAECGNTGDLNGIIDLTHPTTMIDTKTSMPISI